MASKESLHDDIEVISLNHLHHAHSTSEDDDEIILHPSDPDTASLLGSQSRTRGLERLPITLWPQIRSIVIEAAPTLLLTTIGLLFTGKLLDQVSRWRAMRELDQLIMIIPVVLNLKGNIEMNLSARLGTAANVGELDNAAHRRSLVMGNMTLLQVQAVAVSFVAACVSLVLSLTLPQNTTPVSADSIHVKTSEESLRTMLRVTLQPRRAIPHPIGGRTGQVGFHQFIMVAASATTAASLSGLVLGSFMCTLIILCRIFGRDPDNIAPPVASCLGDLITLCLLGVVSNVLIPFLNTPLPFVVFILVISVAFACLLLTIRNSHVRPLLSQGWSPLFGALVISSGTGIVLDLFVSKYSGFAVLAVVISGLPGAVGSIFVSRLSTSLHATTLKYSQPDSTLDGLSSRALNNSSHTGEQDVHGYPSDISPRLVMITLLLITLPVEIIFLTLLHALGWLHPSFTFVAFSVLFFCCAILASLFIARLLTNALWRRGLDPDMYALPIHSALMDLIGQLLLVLCFEVVSLLVGESSVSVNNSNVA
ncbi:hypothetical protein AMATHDRAFT_83860 [Amanita thiersii Skay4041]|uniref:SLC41A/MgtE integral membrane domain-containing protein n=1 Tax=Amanita thiersii Skay4041 TaxID=703135 RepID=A0A2A9NSQ3_9AGAR|nr:hypothetical protein AMATHDRAFT_83860 [Amanita thiersii Skay4041]